MDQEERQRKLKAGRAKNEVWKRNTNELPAERGEPNQGDMTDTQEDPETNDLAVLKDRWLTSAMEHSMLKHQAAGNTCGKVEELEAMVHDGHQQLQSTGDQQQLFTQKDGIISELGEKLADAENALSLSDQELVELRQSTCVADEGCCWDVELHMLTMELQKGQGDSLRETWHTANLPKASGKEQSGLKEQLASEQPAQEQPAVWAHKMQQSPTETQELHTEIFRLSILILDLQQKLEQEEQSGQDLKFTTGRSNGGLQLRVLGEEGAIDVADLDGAHETALQCLREEHRDSIKKLKEQLTALLCYRDEFCQTALEGPAQIPRVKSGKTRVAMEMATGCDRDPVQEILGSSSSENHLMEKYLVMSEKWDSSCLERSNDGLNLLEQVGNFRFEYGSELELQRSKSVNSDLECTEQDHDDQSLIPEAGGGYVSSAMHDTSLHRLSEGSEAADLGKVLLMQQCRDLNEQLTKRDEQLRALQGELRKSAVEVQEALQKWSSVTETLYSVQCELDEERKRRICYQDHLRNELFPGEYHSELDRDVGNLIQKQKWPGVSLTSDVRILFGHQPATLQMQNNELETQRDVDMANQTVSEPLAQKTLVSIENGLHLRTGLEKCREKLDKATKEKAELESQLLCLQQNLANTEMSLGQSSNEKTAQEQCLMGLEFKANNMENIMVSHSEEYNSQLKEKTSDLEVLEEGRMTEEKHQQKEAELVPRKCLREQEQLYKETLEKLCSSHQEERLSLEQKRQQVVKKLHEEMDSKPEELRHTMEKRQREQIMLIKKAHVRKHEREWVELACRQEAELSHLWAEFRTELQESLETAHQAELLQAQQEQHGRELEALWLSLGEQQVAQLERTQDDQQHDSVVVLSELQASLCARWAQESTLLQTCHQRELVATGEDHQQELEEMKLAWEAKLSKQEALLEKQHTTEMEDEDRARVELQTSLHDLLASWEQKFQRLEDDLKQPWLDRNAAASAVKNLVTSHKAVLQEQQHISHLLEETVRAGAEKEQRLQQQVEQLQTECVFLKSGLEQKLPRLGELKVLPLACSSCVEVVENLKQEFAQQCEAIQTRNKLELNNLCISFEKHLCTTEDSYQEEMALLQLRLLQRAAASCGSVDSDGTLEEKDPMLGNTTTTTCKESLQEQLGCSHVVELEQQHNSLHLQHQEELLQVKTILADCYFQKIQELKSKHALELRQLRAKLSDAHVKEITVRVQCAQDVARQVGAELDRVQALAQEHKAYLVQVSREADHSQLKQDFELGVEEGAHGEEWKNAECHLVQQEDLQKDAAEEPWVQEQHLEKKWTEHALQDQLDDEYSLQISAIAQKIFGQLQSERQSMMQEVKKHVSLREKQTEARLKEEQRQLAQQCEHDLSHLRKTHREQLEVLRSLLEMYVLRMEQLEPRLCIRLKGELDSLKVDLSSKHQVELESIEVILQEPNMVQLEACEAELHAEHWREEEVQGRLLFNMEALESICCEKEAMLHLERSSHVAKLEELRRQLTQACVEKFTAMAMELGQAHKVELAGSLASQRQALEEDCVAALGVLQQEVLTLENQHSTTLQELRQQQQAEELSGESVHELEAPHMELEEARRQKEHFQVEMEVLQSQAQEQKLLVSQLERQLSKEHQQSQQPQQEVDLELSQLRVQISNLKGELEGRCSEMAMLETLLQRHERENQEGCHLLAMLRADLNVAAEDRKGLQEVQERLLKLLLDVLRSIVATEDLINQSINKGKPGSSPVKGEDSTHCDSGSDSCLWSTLTEGGLELSQRLGETLLCGPEQLVLEACVRLRSAVGRLLELMAQSDRMAVHSCHGKDDTAQLIILHQQLLEQLDLEASVKKQMELELHKAEGLMEGYVVEKTTLEESLQQKESQEQKLVEELEAMRLQLQELSEENGLLLRQRDALSGVLGEPERGLLDETLRLAQEKLDVQRQAEKDHGGLVSQLRRLETELEEQANRNMELEEQQQAQNEDLLQQIQALEKQLKHHRHFIDCQAMEREHEREEFQQEIRKLEAHLKQQARGCAGDDYAGSKVEDLSLQVESLQASMKEKLDDYSTLLLVKQKYQCEVAEQSEEIDRMAGCMRELEQELDRARRAQLELLQDWEALQQQQYSQCMQISALQSTVDEARHRLPDATPDPELRAELEAVQQDLLSKETQVQMLSGQLEVLQRELTVKEEEVSQLNLQLDQFTKQSSACIVQLQCEVTALQVSSLHREDGGDNKATSSLQLPLDLLEEKNQDTDHLNQQIHQLQQEVGMSQDSKMEVELEELWSLIDHLRNEQQHLRWQHEKEEEQLQGVIHKLREELTQLGSSCLEVSELQEKHRTLAVGRHTSSHDLHSPLNLVHSEKETLQLLLRIQGETFRSQLESLGHSLKEEQQQLAVKKDEVAFLKESLFQRQAQVVQLSTALQELEEHQGQEKLSVVEKEELTAECQALKQREGWLQEEVENLKQEVVLAGARIQELNFQLEAGEVGYAEAHRDVLTYAETTLAAHPPPWQDKGTELEALKVELAAVKEALSSSTERVEKLLEEGQMKDTTLTELHIVNEQLKAELRGLRGKWQLKELHGQYDLQAMPWYSQEAAAGDSLPLLSTGMSVHSPEHLRCQDCSMGHGSRLSDCSSLELCSTEPSLPPKSLWTDTELLGSCSPGPLSDSNTVSMMETLHLEQVEGLQHLHLTPPSTPGGPVDFTSDGYGSNMRSELGARLQMELEATERLDANFLEYLQQRGMTVADNVVASIKLLSPELQGLLKKLNQEACQVLALSQRPCADAVPPGWQGEKRALQETVLSLRELLCRMAEDGPKGQSNEADWRAELIRAVSTMLASEWHWLRSELTTIMAGHMDLDPDSLTEHLKQLLKQQDEHQRSSLQQLLSAERHNLLSELQSLQAQLRIASLQNQEQLQQMQNCLSAVQEDGSQLRRQVELLEFRLQQEQVLVQKLRSSLSLEQDIAAQLRTELEQKHTLLETTASSQQELHSETCRLRAQLESQAVECMSWEEKAKHEKAKVRELQEEVQLGQAKVRELQQEVQREQAKVWEVQQVVHREQQCSQHTHVAQNQVLQHALEQERVQCSNLRKELQIEISRCEALILQESRRASQAVQQLEELTNSFTQEKQDLTVKLEEACSLSAQLTASLTQEKQEKQDLTLKLEEASSYGARLTASLTQERQEKQDLKLKLEKQQGFHDRQQLDSDKQKLQEERRDWQNQQERRHQRLLELEEQQQQRINHFQQTLQDLQGMSSHATACPQSQQQQQLQITRQQLQLARVQVTNLLHRAHSSSDNGWLQQKQGLQELLCTLADLEQDLQQLNSQGLSAEEKAWHTEWASLPEVVGPVIVSDCAKLRAQVQRLYLKYLRAESFRKALVYQKKYLLLQLGGFRDCELATLSLIGLMGACPSPADFKTRPTNRFRTIVCVIIAISRLRFLVKKWHKSVRRGAMNPASNRHGPGVSSTTRAALPMWLQPGGICFTPTHKHVPGQRMALSPVLPPATSASHNLQHRPPPYPDPEHSLSEYIQHLEAIQKRLGAVQKGSTVAVSFLAFP